MSEKHMNTPWTYNNDSGRVEGKHENPKMGSVPIADMLGWGHLTGRTEGYALGLSEAEALEVQRRRGELLATAPDLLAALKELVECAEEASGRLKPPSGSLDFAIFQARAVLARAEGGAE